MILVSKPAAAPAHLSTGNAATITNCAAVEANAQLFLNGTQSFKFDNKIYGHASVKSRLKVAQHDKCCYCEGKFLANSAGDVEHFRPKKGARQGEKRAAEHPGYYWLVYSWPNLYFSCEVCNRSNKKNFFPLRDEKKRARIHTHNVGLEEPILLDPGGPDDPRDHIRFYGIVPKGVTHRGRVTIKTLKLDRPALNDERLEVLSKLQALKEVLEMYEAGALPGHANLAARARQQLGNAIKPNARFSAMAQDFLQRN